MSYDVGKSIATIRMDDGRVYSIFNRTAFGLEGNILFYDDAGEVRYEMLPDQDAVSQSLRCAYYTFAMPNASVDPTPRLVVYVSGDESSVSESSSSGSEEEQTESSTEETSGPRITAEPLYELITPTIHRRGPDGCDLVWWSNVSNATTFAAETRQCWATGKVEGFVNPAANYTYRPELVKRFTEDEIEYGTNGNENTAKIMCEACIYWENLAQVGGGVSDSFTHLTPVIKKINVVTLIPGEGYVTDFTGGNNGAMGIHNHTCIEECGFAAAVFMPSAVMRPFNWR